MSGQPHRNIIRVGVEVLHGMGQSSEGDPRRKHARRHQRSQHISALFLYVGICLVKIVIIKVIFVVAELAAQIILFEVGRNDDLDRALTHARAKCLLRHFSVNGCQHSAGLYASAQQSGYINALGHKLRFPTYEKAQFMTALGIIRWHLIRRR